jgi:glycosyltransferase involved in cell wall biosynthesis
LRSGHGALFRAVRALESRRIARSDHLAGVSHRLADAVERMTGRRDMVVIPCCFDAEAFRFDPQAREQIRAELGFRNGEHVLCYCGGLSEWQRIEDILKVCRELATFEPSMKFLFLTQKTAELVRLAGEVGLDRTRYAALGCLPREVPRYLCAADTGIIMRHDIPVNNVASPIKIGEYLGCGLPVILTPGIGDYSEMLPKAGVGLMLDESGDCARQILDYIRQPEFPALRTKAAEFARAKLSWEAQWPDLQRLFGVEGSQGVEKHV